MARVSAVGVVARVRQAKACYCCERHQSKDTAWHHFYLSFFLYPIRDLCAPTERRVPVSAPLIPAFSPEISTPRRSAARFFAPGMWLEICGPRWYCAARVQLGRPWGGDRVWGL